MPFTDSQTLQTKEFFNRHAPRWDSYEKPDIGIIIDGHLNKISFTPSDKVLDVGCGTGILYPFLQKRGVVSYLGIDLSPKMLEIARLKYPAASFAEADYQKRAIFNDGSFTKIIIYNAFPHFELPQQVISNSYGYLGKGGELYIMHSMSLERLNSMHEKVEGVDDDNMLSCQILSEISQNAGFCVPEAGDTPYYFLKAVK